MVLSIVINVNCHFDPTRYVQFNSLYSAYFQQEACWPVEETNHSNQLKIVEGPLRRRLVRSSTKHIGMESGMEHNGMESVS